MNSIKDVAGVIRRYVTTKGFEILKDIEGFKGFGDADQYILKLHTYFIKAPDQMTPDAFKDAIEVMKDTNLKKKTLLRSVKIDGVMAESLLGPAKLNRLQQALYSDFLLTVIVLLQRILIKHLLTKLEGQSPSKSLKMDDKNFDKMKTL